MLWRWKMLSEKQQELALRQMEGVKPKKIRGKCGRQYDYHKCGNCGVTVEVMADYCFSCGFRLLWDSPRCLTGDKNENS
jgi:hypothetical protein